MINKKSFFFEYLLILCASILIFWCIIGFSVLDPKNIEWLHKGDTSLNYLGWLFFRNDSWQLPLGANPNYGMSIGSSVVYSDSLPLIAVILKLFSDYLPEVFQYFGCWILICFVLQGVFGWLLAGLISEYLPFRVLASVLFILSPAMLFRVDMHLALVSHFLILIAIYLNLKTIPPIKNFFYWMLTILIAAGIHFYIFMMVLLMGIGATFDKLFVDKISLKFKHAFFGTIIFCISISLVFWQLGYFLGVGDKSFFGFGLFRFDGLGFINPNGWSYLIPRIPQAQIKYKDSDFTLADGSYEGFSFLGMGWIVLLIFAIFRISKLKIDIRRLINQKIYFVLSIAIMAILAFSNNVTFGTSFFYFPLPKIIENFLGILRSSGRFIWPSYYLLFVVILWCLNKSFGDKKATILLSIAIGMQIVDTSAGWLKIRNELSFAKGSSFNSELRDPFWDEASKRYSKIIWIPDPNWWAIEKTIDWSAPAYLAGINGLKTNAAYLARLSNEEIEKSQNFYRKSLVNGSFDGESLYILDESLVYDIIDNVNVGKDLLIKVDGVYAFAPNWINCKQCKSYQNLNFSLPDRLMASKTGDLIKFSRGKPGGKALVAVGMQDKVGIGWAYPEEWGVWSNGDAARVILSTPKPQPKSLLLRVKPFLTPKKPIQKLGIWVDGLHKEDLNLSEDKVYELIFNLEPGKISKFVIVDFKFYDAASPKDLGISSDTRKISVGLIEAQFRD